MTNPKDNGFVTVHLKDDVAKQLKQICDDATNNGITINYSDLLRVMLFNGTIIEYSIKKIINDKESEKTTGQNSLPTP